MKTKLYPISIICLCFLAAGAFALPQSSLPKNIADNYLRSFPTVKVEEKNDTTGKGTDKDFDIKEMRPPQLDPHVEREILFNTILAESSEMKDAEKIAPTIFNTYAWNDLSLFFGNASSVDYHLMSKINRTITVAGESVLATLLATPVVNIDALKERQTIVRTFVEKIEDTKTMRSMLNEYKDAENSMLSFYTVSDPLYTKEYRKYMEDYYYAKDGDSSNKSAGWLELKKRFFRDFWGVSFNFAYRLALPLAVSLFSTFGIDSGLNSLFWTHSIPLYGSIYVYKFLSDRNASVPFDVKAYIVLYEIIWLCTAYKGVLNYKEYSSTLCSLAMRMGDVQTFLKTLERLSQYIVAAPELEATYGSKLKATRKLLERAKEDTEIGRMLRYLLELPYRSWSYFFNNAGKLLASHTLFVEYKNEFADAMYELGQLDAYLGVAVLFDSSKKYDEHHSFTFTKFLDRRERDTPYVKLQDMWNPFMDAKQAVGNDVEMGGAVKHITLTGPNAGGKSTFLTGVMLSLVLSQTFGIAPAKEAVITPFDKINTYIDITDDLSAGTSLFMAEVKRAQEHIKIIKGLKRGEFAFTIFDEPFSGTNPTEGGAAEYSILEALAKYQNSLSIVATHYPIVMLLEEKAPGSGFANYKVFITEDKDRLNYSYKVIPGKSTQAIAIRILEEQGFDTALLHRAKDIIKNPQNYTAKF